MAQGRHGLARVFGIEPVPVTLLVTRLSHLLAQVAQASLQKMEEAKEGNGEVKGAPLPVPPVPTKGKGARP